MACVQPLALIPGPKPMGISFPSTLILYKFAEVRSTVLAVTFPLLSESPTIAPPVLLFEDVDTELLEFFCSLTGWVC